jgi:hypothetical protein
MHDNQFIPGDDPADQRRLYGDLAWTWPIMSPPGEYEDEASEFQAAILQHSTIEVHTLLSNSH